MYHIRLQIYKLIFILPPPSPTFFPTFAPQLHSEHDVSDWSVCACRLFLPPALRGGASWDCAVYRVVPRFSEGCRAYYNLLKTGAQSSSSFISFVFLLIWLNHLERPAPPNNPVTNDKNVPKYSSLKNKIRTSSTKKATNKPIAMYLIVF